MARISRKENKFYAVNKKSEKYFAGLYGRISVESVEKQERDSIGTQMTLLHDFADTLDDVIVVDTYIDDDISGTSFDRPAYEDMMRDVNAGRINCIIVKDLSRFARNHLSAGEYLERIFPEKKVRFIAVTDNLDTKIDDGGMIVPIKNVINELYAKEASKKIMINFQSMQKAGQYCGWKAPYGYSKAEDDKHRFVIDKEAAQVVRYIFELYVSGETIMKISKILEQKNIPCPALYMKLHGNGNNTDKVKYHWTSGAVKKILQNKSYLGHMVQRKSKSTFLESGIKDSFMQIDKEDWIIVKGTHEPIISQEVFDNAHQRFAENIKEKERIRQLHNDVKIFPFNLKGKIKCGCCGGSMVGVRKFNNNKPHYYYLCPTHDRYGDSHCTKKAVRMEDTDETVFKVIRRYMDTFLDAKAAMKRLSQKEDNKMKIEQLRLKQRTEENMLSAVRNLKINLYTDMVDGIINEEDYVCFTKQYGVEIKEHEEKINRYIEQISVLKGSYDDNGELFKLVNAYINAKKLSPELVEAFIDVIIINEDSSLNISMKMKDEYDEMMSKLTQPMIGGKNVG